MSVKEVLVDKRTIGVYAPASTSIPIGDLAWWDDTNSVYNTASNRSDAGSTGANQLDFTPIFVGVAGDNRLSTETSTGDNAQRLIIPEGIFDITVASAAFDFGDMVGIDRNSSTPLNYPQQVIKVTDKAKALGYVIRGTYGTSVTTVRCWLSAYEFGWFASKKAAGGIGYPSGSGGSVTQATSRTTGVTLNKITGSIKLVSAAGSSTPFTFTVTNSLIDANDVVVISQASGTDAYSAVCSGITDGTSFKITITDLTGTTTEQPVFNYAIIRGANS